MKQLANRVAVVTGAASGIGRALSMALAGKGCVLALVDLDKAALEEVATEIRATGARVSTHLVDVANEQQMRALPEIVVQAHGAVHIVINNAGVGVSGTIEEQSLDDFEWLVGINFWGVVYGSKFFLPQLRRSDEGHIVNISSLFGIIGVPTQGSYNAAKFAVRGFSEALHAELSETAIGVTVVHPGGVKTRIIQSSRLASEAERVEMQANFDRFAMPPEKAAAKIVRAIEKNQHRVRIGLETYLLDWAKRIFPVLTQKTIALGYRRNIRRAREIGLPVGESK